MRRGLRGEEVQQYSELLGLLQSHAPADDIEDELVWSGKPGQCYTVKSGYNLWNRAVAMGGSVVARTEVFWRAKIPLKVKCFNW
ncbi:hypothetical protein QJS04_geneDACA019042 [Acorus gramineus]|uniref:Uncharacterized protein n=1 Tax=Acorus gramineus TaxID=55184 RepID=A0AAV9A933_ACOGR|nr:hypothetical protein QJS04_geneDACA019042 [Acorus gramineus]